MSTVMAEQIIILAKYAAGADSGRFLANTGMAGSSKDALREKRQRSLFELPYQNHQLKVIDHLFSIEIVQ